LASPPQVDTLHLMGEQQNLATFRRMWDAYATGRLWVMLDELAEDATWRPMGSERIYTGHEQILAWAEQVNRRYKSVTVVFGDMWADGERCVVATGRTIMYDVSGGQAVDTDLGWVCEFAADGRVSSMTALDSHAATRAFASARSAQLAPG
jgi:ketosteroid isomerase-like protein